MVVVEGASDQVAVLALAQRRGRDLDREGISVVPMGGAHAIGRFLREWGPQGRDLRLAGLCDGREEGDFRRALAGAGLGPALTREAMERLGFYVCEADLEDELIRALGPDSVERVLGAEGDLKSFRSFQRQPAQQGRAVEAQLRRFMGTRSGRKVQYARALVAALDLDRAPRPLDRLLGHIRPCTKDVDVVSRSSPG